MSSLILSIIFILAAIAAFKYLTVKGVRGLNKIAGGVFLAAGLLVNLDGLFSYNDAGFCQHIRTITGSESFTCKTGWYVVGYGKSNAWPWAEMEKQVETPMLVNSSQCFKL